MNTEYVNVIGLKSIKNDIDNCMTNIQSKLDEIINEVNSIYDDSIWQGDDAKSFVSTSVDKVNEIKSTMGTNLDKYIEHLEDYILKIEKVNN